MFKKNIFSLVAKMIILIVLMGSFGAGLSVEAGTQTNPYFTVTYPDSVLGGNPLDVKVVLNGVFLGAYSVTISGTAVCGEDYTVVGADCYEGGHILIPPSMPGFSLNFLVSQSLSEEKTLRVEIFNNVFQGFSWTGFNITLSPQPIIQETYTIVTKVEGGGPKGPEDFQIRFQAPNAISIVPDDLNPGVGEPGQEYTYRYYANEAPINTAVSGVPDSEYILSSKYVSPTKREVIYKYNPPPEPVDPPVVSMPTLTASPSTIFRGGSPIFSKISATLPDEETYAEPRDFEINFEGSSADLGVDYAAHFLSNYNSSTEKFTFPAGVNSVPVLGIIALPKTGDPSVVTVNLKDDELVANTNVVLTDAIFGECNGEVAGIISHVGSDESQKDIMITNFNSHVGAEDKTGPLTPPPIENLGIITPGLSGYAPSKEQAACVMDMGQNTNTYALKGYAWNTNLGFISFYCNGKEDQSGSNNGVACGEYAYEVVVGPKITAEGDDKGKRLLSGSAWNPSFGYISFSDASANKFYQVKATQIEGHPTWWRLSGYAWTGAGVYMKMDGIEVELLPGAAGVCEPLSPGWPLPVPPCPPCLQYERGGERRACCEDKLSNGGEVTDADCCQFPEHKDDLICPSPETGPCENSLNRVCCLAQIDTGVDWPVPPCPPILEDCDDLDPVTDAEELFCCLDNKEKGVMPLDTPCPSIPVSCDYPVGSNDKICCDAMDRGEDPLPLECCTADFPYVERPDDCPVVVVGPCDHRPTDLEKSCCEQKDETGSVGAECCDFSEYQYEPICINGEDGSPSKCDPEYFTTPGVCVDVKVSSDPDYLPVADCTDGYDIHLYLNGEDGKRKDYDNEFISLMFNWQDTVKINQVDGEDVSDLNPNSSPWGTDGSGGGIKHKPITIVADGSEAFAQHFTKVGEETGHYISTPQHKVTSCAPTSGGNFSLLKTVMEFGKPALFDNENFIGMSDLRENMHSNDLILDGVSWMIMASSEPFAASGGVSTPISQQAHLRFRPAFEISELYTNDLQDAITGYRDIPFEVNVEYGENGSWDDVAKPANVKAKLVFAYDSTVVSADGNCKGKAFGMEITKTFNGISSVKTCDNDKLKGKEGVECAETWTESSDFSGTKTFSVTPRLPEGEAICSRMTAPAIYSVIEYTIGGKTVKYYSNKLPKLAGSFLDNLVAIIHGTIYSSMNFSPDEKDVVSSLGSVVSNAVRDAVHKNVNKHIKGSDEVKGMDDNLEFENGDDDRCVAGLSGTDFSLTCESGSVSNKSDKITLGNGEEAYYLYGVDLIIGAPKEGGGPHEFDGFGKQIFVVEGGNILINADINTDDKKTDQLVVVAMQAKDEVDGVMKNVGGNIYIADDVRTLANVALLADGAVHPFPKVNAGTGVFDLIDENTGEFEDAAALANFYRGDHQDSYQLFIKGAVSARTVKGISNITKDDGEGGAENLIGTNETAGNDENAVFKSMFFDWNAFRFYKGGDFVRGALGDGPIMDLSCGHFLTVGEMVTIANGGEVLGVNEGWVVAFVELGTTINYTGNACDINGSDPTRCKCDGIHAEVYGSKGVRKGDLIRNYDKESPLARTYKPFYLYYIPLDSAILKAE